MAPTQSPNLCVDVDDSDVLITVSEGTFVPVCEWAAENPSERCEQTCPCDDFNFIKDICRETCNNCVPTMAPTQTTNECVDIDDSNNLITIGEDTFIPICEWAAENPSERCDEKCPCDGFKTFVKDLCRETCNNCAPTMSPTISPEKECVDSNDIDTLITVAEGIFLPVCEWAAENPYERCEQECPCDNHTPVKDLCRYTCNNCKEPLVPTNGGLCARLTPIERLKKINDVLLGVSGYHLLADNARNSAFQWLLEGDCGNICPDDPFLVQRYVLAVLYFSTSGENWKTSDFLSCSHECGWFPGRIQCNNRKEVTKILLDGNNLVGEIPFELQELQSLEELNLRGNMLRGSIPGTIGNLPLLQVLDFSKNDLKSSIPASLFSLKNLSSLQLHNNRLDGKIPSQMGNLKSLENVQLYKNVLVGQIPNMVKLHNLVIFSAHGNNLVGNVSLTVCPLRTNW
eukprot:CAMPEP_0113329790 /NCGR_PEP_ID=MMETSP0010_2-20120614/21159_1 /TAXON_ID=216773 ORGANISM="Corethron hystrix, Strain 308" /NCGR_SAMPLE_ID=MMETSP0010_2 /ASSEMBLY_ACC=CAM_ASM_000155 /LENGTH=456 /DNA_ID=CAMNT_0000192045 /DNA_START=70 /DNA_END=1437 /DNA_ORIENTATION=+ /assembly_acc=CAM_ASM_000155